MIRRYYLNNTLVNDPVNFEEFNQLTGRDSNYVGIFKKVTSVSIRWQQEGKEFLDSQYNQYGSAWRGTTLRVDRSTDNGLNYATEFEFVVDYEKKATGFDGQAEYIEVGLKQVGLLQKFLSRDDIDLDIQSLVNIDGGAITPFASETTDLTLDNQVIEKRVRQRYDGDPSNNAFFATTDTSYAEITAQLPFNTKPVNQFDDVFSYQGAFYADQTITPTGQTEFTNQERPFEVWRVANSEFYESVEINLNAELRFAFTTFDPVALIGAIEVVFVVRGEKYEDEDDTQRLSSIISEQSLGTFNLTGSVADGLGNTVLQTTISIDETIVIAPFGGVLQWTQNDRVYAYLAYRNVPGQAVKNGQLLFRWETTGAFLNLKARSVFPDTTAKVILIHDFIKRMLQQITGLQEPIRSDFYGHTGTTYSSSSGPQSYASNGEGWGRSVSNIFQVRQFPITGNNARPMITSFKEFYKFLWSMDTIGVGLEFDGVTPYFRIEPIEFFYDKTSEILDIPINPKTIPQNVDPSLSYNVIRVGDTNYKDEEFGILDATNAPREFSIFTESEKTKTYDIRCPQITNGTVIELSRRRGFVNFETEDTTYDDDIVIIQVTGTPASFTREDSSLVTSSAGIDVTKNFYNLRLSPKRRLERHLKILTANLWGVIENPDDYGNPNIQFVESKGLYSYSTQLSGEASSIDENANIAIENIEPLYTDDKMEFEVPLSVENRDLILNSGSGHFTVTSRGQVYEFFLNNAAITDYQSGMVTFRGRKVYRP